MQLFAPFGSSRYSLGTMPTTYNFTGQRLDSETGLLYYGARYYDPFSARFVQADSVQNNAGGLDPYAYVGENPETRTDPSGRYYSNGRSITEQGGAVGYVSGSTITTVINDGYGSVWTADGQYYTTGGSLSISSYTWQQASQYGGYNPYTDAANSPGAKLSNVLGLHQLQQTWSNPNATWQDKAGAVFQFIGTNVNNAFQLIMIFGEPEDEGVASAGEEAIAAEEEAASVGEESTAAEEGSSAEECGALSFTPTTPVATAQGKQAIGTMKVGEQVWAYNPRTQKMELKPVLHVWINHDNDLVDLTLTIMTTGKSGKAVIRSNETIHTNKKHPFLTKEQGFLPVGQITIGMHVLRANGTYGIVTGWKVVSGTRVMYNLEVSQDHTFTVGAGQWVVHNATCSVKDLDPLHSPGTSGRRPYLENLSDQELLDSVNNNPGDPIQISTKTGKVVEGNGRAYELLRRAALPGSSITPDTPIYYEPYTPSSIPEPWEEPPDPWNLPGGEWLVLAL